MKKQVHVVPHMHWDREWYFTTEESRILLINNMEEILTRLENDPEYKYYVLDGQTVVLEDYLDIKPEYTDRVKNLIQAGKLIIGPWYTQTDEIIVGGESVVRNLVYGLKDCEPFGAPMMIGYLPDSFGQSEQMPQILNKFGINRSLFWRGVSEMHGTDKTEFFWEGHADSKVITQVFPLGYAIGKYLPNDKEALKKRLDTYLKVLENGATTENLILPNGHDQMPIQQDIFEVMEKLNEIYPEKNFFMSRFEHVFEGLEAQSDKLDTISGEFLDGKYMRVHKSIYSTRIDIKIIHAEIENKITNTLEPLASIAWSLGFEYHHGLIEKIWKIIMKNHAHDSIGCCCSDIVHSQILARFELADDMVNNLIKFYKRKIVDAMPNKDDMDKLTVFNLMSYARREKVEAVTRIRSNRFSIYDSEGKPVKYTVLDSYEIDPGLVDRQIVHYGVYEPFVEYKIQLFDEAIPAMGYKTYYIKGNDETSEIVEAENKEINALENDFYKVTVNENGSINVFDKELNKTYENCLLAENGSDDGDEYDFSPMRNDWIFTSEDVEADVRYEVSLYEQKAIIKYTMEVPADLESRANRVKDATVDFELSVSLSKNVKRVDCEIKLNNQAKDHRVRFICPTSYASDFSITDNQFGTINRPVIEPADSIWEEEKWKEKPVAINPMLSFAGLTNEEEGFAILSNGIREYEIIGEDFSQIALTLFRSVGVLGKEELLYRPGRPSGIKMPTPDSQMIGELKAKFALFSHKGHTIDAQVPAAAREFCTELHVYNKIPYNAMKLNNVNFTVPDSFSLFEKEKNGTVLSVVKKSEKEDKLIIRFFNPSRENTIEDEIKFIDKEVIALAATNLNEVEEKKLDYETLNNLGQFKACEVKTFAIEIK